MDSTEERDPWALESGLPNDVDGWIRNPHFGIKEEYKQAVAVSAPDTGGVAGLMFIVDLYDEHGEMVGSQGFSVGSGWIPSDDGKSMHHPTRANVVNSTLYGRLQTRVMRDLGVNMKQYGIPIHASSWDGLGFHWMLEEHATIQGQEPKPGIMPTIFLGRKEPGEAAPSKPAQAPAGGKPDAMLKLKSLAEVSPDVKTFQKAALRLEDVTGNDALMAEVLDEGPNGFYQKNKPA